jgi:hypothetical protein
LNGLSRKTDDFNQKRSAYFANRIYQTGSEAGLEAIIANANSVEPKYAGNNSTIEVDLYKNGGSTQTTNFTLVVY